MNRNTANLYVAVGVTWLILSLIMLAFVTPSMRLVPATSAVTAVSIIYAGCKNRVPAESADRPSAFGSREELMIKSMFPGYVQLRVFGKAEGVALAVLFGSGLAVATVGFHSLTTGADLESLNRGFMASMYGLVIVVFSIVWSALEVNDFCDRCRLPREGGVFEMKWNDTELGLKLLVAITLTCVVGLYLGFYFGGVS
ncbi:MAG: hypothetical protein LBS92_01020 [Candidatus Methanoplasma sp.]|nr:hypothetical protein [Candidatus Methanoplasma sp.]